MADIAKLVEDLKSPHYIIRFDACEALRVAPSLPPTAIAALEKALSDPDGIVRESAESALRVHKPRPASQPMPRATPIPGAAAQQSMDAKTILAEILAQEKEHTRLLHNISTAATAFSLLVLLSLALSLCSVFRGGF